MAQPVFDDHPLEQYLREAGEAPELMPGGSVEFLPTAEQEDELEEPVIEDGTHYAPDSSFLRVIIQAIQSMVTTQSSEAFVERFKYSVISSSLLSSSLVQPHSSHVPRLPGHHSRNSSIEPSESHSQPFHSLPHDSQYYTLLLALAFAALLFGTGYYFTSALVFGISTSLMYFCNPESPSKYDMTPYLDTLNDLIAAGNVWDSVVQEAMTTLEKEETTSNTPFTPSSSLRVALHSTLLTTQNQCDDVRQLLSALASQSELSQILEMYAPPSPLPSKFSPPRPSSFPQATRARSRTISAPDNKRATWNGSYTFLANAGSPSAQITKRREKRRSDLSALLEVTGTQNPSMSLSAPVTPSHEETDRLEGVAEEESESGSNALPDGKAQSSTSDYQPFGAAALRLRRRRMIGGLNVIRSSVSVPNSPPLNSASSPNSLTQFPVRSPRSPQFSQFATLPAASRFTIIQAPRHPLSSSSLHLALQNALASKRYACSHLLALRFAEEKDDEAYWEDVKSVMMLLTSSLVDASARLTEALDLVDDQKRQDETPSPSATQTEMKMADALFGDIRRSSLLSRRRTSAGDSFAPMPSHLSRFATHVEAISTALEDAREQLIECVSALKSEANSGQDGAEASEQSTEVPPSPASSAAPAKDEHPALQAYERLRRELGLALRECERGRERLLDSISPPQQHSEESEDESSSEEQEHPHDLPGLGHDGRSDESSEKPESMSPLEFEVSPDHPLDRVAIAHTLDDVTAHLLRTSTSEHLPPPGIEQVYEADSGSVGAFARERSKLTREERIQLARKAKEEAQNGRLGGSDQFSSSSSRERWGPGGEVVQELKDVIWKVGERRRKMADGQMHNVVPEALRILE
ncbi:hypothetical protein GYMLUDRAFT_87054 [Collybiopsis luxurians FD-317 M1]|uniref:Myosin-binding domain-containing protein n=1 Tax=Collybiopsis luxurians FD-317 M1 TaxID=944289 RepID=A0A0D0B1P7_9AGAR|nr:hypothetical protein GYMLUDRAFT_87054 [Collybiopsis luxurians FD-317 M1]